MRYFAVRNGAGLITCVTDDQRVHAALWLTRGDAQDHADRMLDIQHRKINVSAATTPTTFDIVEVDIP